VASYEPTAYSWMAGWSTHAATELIGGDRMMCGRRYLTKEEKIEWLEDYKTNLEKELQGVTERIQELKTA